MLIFSQFSLQQMTYGVYRSNTDFANTYLQLW